MVKQLSSSFFILFLALVSIAQPKACTHQYPALRADFQQRLAENQLNDTLQTITTKLEKQYQEADCLEQWLKIHIELFDKQKKINRATAIKWLEKNTEKAFRKPTSKTEDSLMMMSLIKKGYTETRLSRIPEARRSYENARKIREQHQLGDPNWMATYLYKTLGSTYTRLGDYDKAVNYLSTAKGMCSADYRRQGSIYSDLGVALKEKYHGKEEVKEALNVLQETFKLEGISNYHKALLFNNIAEVNLELRDSKQALHYIKECLKLFDQHDPENNWGFKGTTMTLLARIYASIKDPRTEQTFEQAIQLEIQENDTPYHREIAKTYIYLGDFLLRNQKPEKAMAVQQKALLCLLPDFQPKLVTDNPGEAHLYAENSIYDALDGKAKALIALDENLPTALETYTLILDVEEKLRKYFQFDQAKLTLYKEGRERNEIAIKIAHRLYQETKNQKYLETAFRFAENSKAAILLEALNRQQSALITGIPDSLMVEDKALRSAELRNKNEMAEIRRGHTLTAEDEARLEILEKRQVNIYNSQLALQEHLNTTYPDYSKLSYQRPAVSMKKLQKDLIQQNEAFIEYFFGKDRVFAFVITKDELKCLDLGPSAPLNAQLLAVKKQLGSKSYSQELSNGSFRLYQQLIQKLQLPNNIDKLSVVTDGYLNYLPLQALTMSAEGNATDYLINKYLINYTYSSDIYFSQLQEETKSNSNGILAFAPIQFPRNDQLSTLPLTEKFIQHLSKEHKGEFLTGEKATKQAFTKKAEAYETLVLATHAEAGQQPQIHFYDQPVTLNELYEQQLNASTAILMACSTADGVLEGGEGVMSLTRALRYAGVPSVTSSLWEVAEESSATIITDMLANLKVGMPKDKALRTAQLKFITEVSERPWRWAAFVHIGNAFPLKQSKFNWLGIGSGVGAFSLLLAVAWFLLRRKQ